MIANFHAQAIAHARGGRLVGVADAAPGKVRSFSGKHRAVAATTSVDERVDELLHTGHQLQIQDWGDAVSERRPPAVRGQEARNAVALIRALYASAERRVPVRL
jgi:predicted dehydrogenase